MKTGTRITNLWTIGGQKMTMRKQITKALTVAVVAAVTILAATADAADVTWQSPVAATGDGTADIDKSGKLVYAFNYGYDAIGNTKTIAGVTFADVPVLPGSTHTTGFTKFAVTTDGGNQNNYTALHTGTTGDYRDLMSSTAIPGKWEMRLNELTPGEEYLVQFWLYESRYGTQTQKITGGANQSGSLALSIGHYVIGTFIADATTQKITFSNDMWSALQLRQLNPAGTPGTVIYVK